MEKLGTIYSLNCPITNLVRYIGQTKNLYNKRFDQHKYQWSRCKGKLSHLNSWIKSLYEQNLRPILEIVEDNIKLAELDFKEKQYIKLFKSFGADLTNSQEGGGVYNFFTQKNEWKVKRLKSLETSVAWKERNKRHSLIMKEKHKNGIVKIGLNSLTEEQKKECIKRLQSQDARKFAL